MTKIPAAGKESTSTVTARTQYPACLPLKETTCHHRSLWAGGTSSRGNTSASANSMFLSLQTLDSKPHQRQLCRQRDNMRSPRQPFRSLSSLSEKDTAYRQPSLSIKGSNQASTKDPGPSQLYFQSFKSSYNPEAVLRGLASTAGGF